MLNITVVGSRDKPLEQLLQAAGGSVNAAGPNGLAAIAAAPHAPDVVVLDIRATAQIPPSLAAIRRQHPATGIIIVAPALDPALLLDAMRAGVNEFVTDPLTQANVERAIASVVGQRAPAEAGKMFGVIGAKGGVGTTTIAVNLATALGAASKPDRTLLIDLHRAGGDAAVFLGVEPQFSIVDAFENIHRLDAAYLGGLVTRVAPGVDLLASSDRALTAPIDAPKVRKVLAAVASTYRYTVLDLPRSDGAVLDALDPLTAIVIVVNQELATVRNATRVAATLRQRYGRERIAFVLSRLDRHADISQEDVERAIGGRVEHTLPSDYAAALHALHKGRPLVLDNHNELSGSLRRFAFALAGVPREAPAAAKSPGLLGLFAAARRA